MKKPKREKSISQLKKEADKVVSEYIRRRDNGICFTCQKKDEWKYMQCGHFISRVYSNLRYYEKNLNCQCYSCNCMKHGNMDEYAYKLEQKYGKGIVSELIRWKRMKATPFSRKDLEEVIKDYKSKLNSLDNTLLN